MFARIISRPAADSEPPPAWGEPTTPWLRARGNARHALNRALDRVGLEVVPTRHPETLEPRFLELYERCAPYTMTSRERMYALWQAVTYVQAANIPGDVVECGVWRGGSTMLAASALADTRDSERRLWLYDTYEGMVEPDAVDVSPDFDARPVWEAQQEADHNEWCYSPLDEVQANMRSTGLAEDRFEFVKGRVEETIPARAPQQIALLRLDTDFYESTKHELEQLFPLLAPQGVLIIDDYGYWEGSRRATDEYFAAQGVKMLFSRIDETGRMGIKHASS